MLMSYGYELLCISPCLHFVDFRLPVPASSLTYVQEGVGGSGIIGIVIAFSVVIGLYQN